MRDVYEGCIPIADTDYSDDGGETEIEDLDVRVSQHLIMRFHLDYPFEKPFDGTVVTDAGPTLRQIIDAIRAAYRTMYRGVTIEDIPGYENKRVRGNYGEAIHIIEDLVIERISIGDETGSLDISIGS